MFRSNCDISSLNPEIRKEILDCFPDATLLLLLDKQRKITPIAINPDQGSETKFIDRETAEKIAMDSEYAALSDCLKFMYGETNSGWCLVDGGGGYLVWNYHP